MIGSVATRTMKATMTTKTTTWAAQIAVAVLLLATGTAPASSGLLAENSPRGKNTLEGGFHRAWSSVSVEPHRGWGEVCAGSAADSVVAPKVGRSELGNALSDLGTNPVVRNINRLEEFGPGAGFSGVLDVESGKFLAYASGETKLASGAIPANRVVQFGGHQDVNAALSGVLGKTSTNRLGFSAVLDAEGNFAVRFNSGINSANPNVLNRTVPESMRQQILDAITKSTGRKAYSAQ
jgi:hypothetical protein